MIKKRLVINGLPRTLLVNPDDTLAKVLREQLLLTGCKIGSTDIEEILYLAQHSNNENFPDK